MEPNEKAEPVRKTAGIREMIARNCFEKTGRIPDVEFMDTYEVKKAADESDFNEMADTYSRKNRQREIAETNPLGRDGYSVFDIQNADDYADLMRGNLHTGEEFKAGMIAQRNADKKQRKEASKKAQPYGHKIARTVDAASSTSVPDEEKAKYLFNQPEELGKKANIDHKRTLIPSDFYNAIDGIVNSHLSDIGDENRAKLAKELYDLYMDRFYNASYNSKYL